MSALFVSLTGVPTMCQYALDLGLVPLSELNNRSSCEGGKHGESEPASEEYAPSIR